MMSKRISLKRIVFPEGDFYGREFFSSNIENKFSYKSCLRICNNDVDNQTPRLSGFIEMLCLNTAYLPPLEVNEFIYFMTHTDCFCL